MNTSRTGGAIALAIALEGAIAETTNPSDMVQTVSSMTSARNMKNCAAIGLRLVDQ